ncbi:MAG: anhydro-N-acetylmuramic acid kinase [Methylophilaceae bacterium]
MTAGELYIGLMSGTSLDGVDAVLVEFKQSHIPKVIATHFVSYPTNLREQILALQHPTINELEITCKMGNQLAQLYAKAINELLNNNQVSQSHITAIGCHGQTIRHRPELGFTLQIGNNALLAELTNVTVIGDFRSRDIAAGGQGAPLVPAFHQAAFSHPDKNRMIVNIGGIANITSLEKSGQVLGFDSGPGNMLMDYWTKLHLDKNYDANGEWAATGLVIDSLLFDMLADPYFALPPPKSTGRDLFNENWLKQHLTKPNLRAQDVARTLVELSVQSIYDAMMNTSSAVDEVYLCGGGAHNGLLVERLKAKLGDKIYLTNTDALGIGVDWLEAVAFAWLARQTISGKCSNLPQATGANGPKILGAIYQH